MNQVLPKYYQIKQDLLDDIRGGRYRPGALIPSEKELMDEYMVSRITVRKALDDLSVDGYVYRIQGKGTFVGNPPTRGIGLQSFSKSCIEEITDQGMQAARKVIKSEIVSCNDELSAYFELEPGTPLFYYERAYLADGVPVAYAVDHYRADLVPGIEDHDFTDTSVFHLLRNKYGIANSTYNVSFRAILAHGDVALNLGVEEGFPVLQMRGRTSTILEDGIEVRYHIGDDFWRTDILSIEL